MRRNVQSSPRAHNDMDAASHCDRSGEPEYRNAPDDVLGEVALTLVAILGIVLALNLLLSALHIS